MRSEQRANDITYALPFSVADHDAMMESISIDVPRDKRWFREHPEANQRLRVATSSELRATGLPEGTYVLCERIGADGQARTFLRTR